MYDIHNFFLFYYYYFFLNFSVGPLETLPYAHIYTHT